MHKFLRLSLVMPTVLAALALSGCPFGPRLSLSVNVLRFNFDNVSQNYETVETFIISNTGSGELSYTITVDKPWVSVTPTTGSAITGDTPVTVTVTVDREFSNAKAADFATATITVASNGGDLVITATAAPDYFTEAFAPGEVDLDGLDLTFTPSGGLSFYEATKAEITEFPIDPSDGSAFPLDFGAFGDPIKAGIFGGQKVSYYGKEYDTLYISSEGWVSFGEPGNSPVTTEDHFETPQISGLPVDGTQAGAVVSYQQDADFLTITYENAGTKGVPGFPNNFQIRLGLVDGELGLSFLDTDPALSGVLGLSNGLGAGGSAPSDFVESDLSNANTDTVKAAL